MKILVVSLAVLLIFFSNASAGDLKKLSLDDASSIGLTIHADRNVTVEGKSSIRVRTLWPTTVCLGQVTDLSIENAQLIYSARVKSALNGQAYLEMWAHMGGRQYFSRGMNNPINGESDWKVLQTPFIFQKGQQPDKLTLNLVINGTGTVWIDDIVLSKKPLQ